MDKTKEKERIAQELEKLRVQRGFSYNYIASELNMSQPQVFRIFNGENNTQFDNLQACANLLGASVVIKKKTFYKTKKQIEKAVE